jgi:hypothetical protein
MKRWWPNPGIIPALAWSTKTSGYLLTRLSFEVRTSRLQVYTVTSSSTCFMPIAWISWLSRRCAKFTDYFDGNEMWQQWYAIHWMRLGANWTLCMQSREERLSSEGLPSGCRVQLRYLTTSLTSASTRRKQEYKAIFHTTTPIYSLWMPFWKLLCFVHNSWSFIRDRIFLRKGIHQ